VHLERGSDVSFPDIPAPRWNLDTAKEVLGEFTGIEAVPLLENSQSPSEPSAVNIRHCAPFMFQPQEVVASRNMTFPWLDDPFFRRHVIDGLDYLLGLVRMKTMALRAELRQFLVEQRTAEQAAEETRRLKARGFERGLLSNPSRDSPRGSAKCCSSSQRETAPSRSPIALASA
jgi:hypothetical protein